MVAGILALVYPDITLLALALIAGINVFLFGLLGIVNAISADQDDAVPRALVAILGILGVLAGLIMMRRPGETLLVLLLAVGLWLIMSGVISGIIALTEPEDRGARLLAALFDIVLGGLLLALPKLSLATVAILCGVSFLIRGAFALYVGLKLRKGAAAVVAPASLTPGLATTSFARAERAGSISAARLEKLVELRFVAPSPLSPYDEDAVDDVHAQGEDGERPPRVGAADRQQCPDRSRVRRR